MKQTQLPSTTQVKRGRGRPVGSSVAADREEIIEAAIRAVRRDGPGVTMASIAAEAGVTKPVVYRAVGDKEAVAVAVSEHLSRQVEVMTTEVLESEPSSRARFRVATRNYFELLSSERQLFLFVAYGWGSHDGTQLEAMIDRSAEPFIRTERARSGEAQADESRNRTFAYAAVGALRTVAVMWVRNPYCTLDEITDDVTDYVFRP
jgi:AcrR family transcriptional regulator